MIYPYQVMVQSEDETASLARSLAAELNPGDLVSLNGNLGAGKTFFIKNVCREWNINNVNSPTFAIVNEYNGSKKVYHFDFYRINTITELLDIGFNDYLNDNEAVIFIEWGDLFSLLLPKQHLVISIEILNGDSRNFKIEKHG